MHIYSISGMVYAWFIQLGADTRPHKPTTPGGIWVDVSGGVSIKSIRSKKKAIVDSIEGMVWIGIAVIWKVIVEQ